MSRRGFRSAVEAPRPTSAWALVTVASATLWITQQLDNWAIAVQVLAILVSLWRRTEPFSWQTNAIVLNLGMLGVTAATIGVALRGDPSTIALAHFAALAQGLQLIDARPRHTEFLLVALALFQVVLASNLTDSVFFPPLLITFVFAAVWTLMVHTLRTEAIEAGDPNGVNRAITPGLARTTVLASGLSVVLALVLFVSLPRLRSSVITPSGLGSGLNLPTAGFSSRVELGELGRIRSDSRVVLRVETIEDKPHARETETATETYWRGLAFDHFDGASWSITPPHRSLVPGSAEGGVSLGSENENPNARLQRIVREPVAAGVLFASGPVQHLQGAIRRLERDTSGGLYAAGQADERVRYRVATLRTPRDDAGLLGDFAAPPRRNGERYLQLPPLSPAVAELAADITRTDGLARDVERVRAIEAYLTRNGRYTNIPPWIDPSSERSPIEEFLLGELAGHCEYFASAMVVLTRSLGIPARLVNGFAGGSENSIGNFLEVTRSDAHTWVEVHYAQAGWVRYDPTPADLRARAAVALSAAERMRQLASAIELWWFQRVVGFDRSDQIHALKEAWLAWRAARSNSNTDSNANPRGLMPAQPERRLPGMSPSAPALAALGFAAALGVVLWRLRSRRRPALPPSYAAALALLKRRGLVRGPSLTARDFACSARTALPPAAAAAFGRLTETYLAERFGGHSPAPRAAADLDALRLSLRSTS